MPSGVALSCTPGLSCPTALALVSGSAPCCTPARSPLQPRSGPLAGPCPLEREWQGRTGWRSGFMPALSPALQAPAASWRGPPWPRCSGPQAARWVQRP